MYIKREIDENLTIFRSSRFKYTAKKNSCHRYRVTVGIGGNVGDVRRRFEHLFVYLKRDKRVKLTQRSLILKNPPFGFESQDDFFNSIIVLYVSMQPMAFLNYLMRVEKKFRRKRSFANAPRTLDLDIIFFDGIVVNRPKLQIPHPAWFERESVLIPMMDIKE